MIAGGQGQFVEVPIFESFTSFMMSAPLHAVGFFERSEHPSEGMLHQKREPSSFSGCAPEPHGHAPFLGEHSEEIRKR